jgi:hypothetical protein
VVVRSSASEVAFHFEADLVLLDRLFGFGAILGRLAALGGFDVVDPTILFVFPILHDETPEKPSTALHSRSEGGSIKVNEGRSRLAG